MTPLSESQIEQSDAADAKGENFANVTPIQLFGPNASGTNLSQTVYRVNPRRYRQLRDEYELEIGVMPRPVGYWHGR